MILVLVKPIITLLCLLLANVAFAEYAVVVNSNNTNPITQTDVIRIFLAKIKTFPDGKVATPINQPETSPARQAFESKVIGKTEAQLKAYWARMLFTGKSAPLKEAVSNEEVVKAVTEDTEAISYIDTDNLTDNLRIIFTY